MLVNIIVRLPLLDYSFAPAQTRAPVQEFGWCHLSAGDLLRAERATGSADADLINTCTFSGWSMCRLLACDGCGAMVFERERERAFIRSEER